MKTYAKKNDYQEPRIDKVVLDNEISLTLDSGLLPFQDPVLQITEMTPIEMIQ